MTEKLVVHFFFYAEALSLCFTNICYKRGTIIVIILAKLDSINSKTLIKKNPVKVGEFVTKI